MMREGETPSRPHPHEDSHATSVPGNCQSRDPGKRGGAPTRRGVKAPLERPTSTILIKSPRHVKGESASACEAGPGGFEPPTSGLEARRSVQAKPRARVPYVSFPAL